MHGGITIMTRNIRRRGVKASNPDYVRSIIEGLPTREREAKSGGHFHVGDDKQGTRIYQFCDSPIDRMYARLVKAARNDADAKDELRREYTALKKFRHHWHLAGKEVTVGSVDLNRIFTSDPSRRQGMPMAEGQMHHDTQWRGARGKLEWKQHIVVENVICSEQSLEIAGYAVGFISRSRASEGAEKMIREAGKTLSQYWGVG